MLLLIILITSFVSFAQAADISPQDLVFIRKGCVRHELYRSKPTWFGLKRDLKMMGDYFLSSVRANPEINVQDFLWANGKNFQNSTRLFNVLSKVIRPTHPAYAIAQEYMPFQQRALERIAGQHNSDAQVCLVKYLIDGTFYYKDLPEAERLKKLQFFAYDKKWQPAQDSLAEVIYSGKMGFIETSTQERFNRLREMGEKGWGKAREKMVMAIDFGLVGQRLRSFEQRKKHIKSLAESGWKEAQEIMVRDLSFSTLPFEEELTQLRSWAEKGWPSARKKLIMTLANQTSNPSLDPKSCFKEIHDYAQKGVLEAQEIVAKALYEGTLGQENLSLSEKLLLLQGQAEYGNKKARYYLTYGILTGTLEPSLKYLANSGIADKIIEDNKTKDQTIINDVFDYLFNPENFRENLTLLKNLSRYYPQSQEWLDKVQAKRLISSKGCFNKDVWSKLQKSANQGSKTAQETVVNALLTRVESVAAQSDVYNRRQRLNELYQCVEKGWPAAQKALIQELETGNLCGIPNLEAARFLRFVYGILNT